jgi:group I intron endonuclease
MTTEVYGVLYKITNTVTGDIYIGQTITRLRVRFVKHLSDARCGKATILCHAIRKYGQERFVIALLQECASREELDAAEIETIAELAPRYNACAGGGGLGSPAPQVRAKISAAMRKRKFSEGHKQRISLGLQGRKLTPESVAKIQSALAPYYAKKREARMAKYGTLERVRAPRPYVSPHQVLHTEVGAESRGDKISAVAQMQYQTGVRKRLTGVSNPMFGRAVSEQRRHELSEQFSGEHNPYFGKTHSAEARAKMSAAHAARPNLTCPYCARIGSMANMKRWHFDNCRAM